MPDKIKTTRMMAHTVEALALVLAHEHRDLTREEFEKVMGRVWDRLALAGAVDPSEIPPVTEYWPEDAAQG